LIPVAFSLDAFNLVNKVLPLRSQDAPVRDLTDIAPESIFSVFCKRREEAVNRSICFLYHFVQGKPFIMELFAFFEKLRHEVIIWMLVIALDKIYPEGQRRSVCLIKVHFRIFEKRVHLAVTAHLSPHKDLGPGCSALCE